MSADREQPADLKSLLELEPLERDLFRGRSRQDGLPQLFGGQVVAQALLAAAHTVDTGRLPNSLHAYFLRPGNPSRAVVYEVERSRDGGSIASRNVQAVQDGEVILSMMASFHREEAGFVHHAPMPVVPPPQSFATAPQQLAQWEAGPRDTSPGMLGLFAIASRVGIEVRPVTTGDAQSAGLTVWLRVADTAVTDAALRVAMLAYASDFGVLGSTKLCHGGYFNQPELITASLDHVLWFHRAPPVDQWLLYVMESPVAHGARAFARGLLFDQDGQLVTSVAQEGLLRHVRAKG